MQASALFHSLHDINKNIFKIEFGGINISFNNYIIKEITPWAAIRENESFEIIKCSKDVMTILSNLNCKYAYVSDGMVKIKIQNWKIIECRIIPTFINN